MSEAVLVVTAKQEQQGTACVAESEVKQMIGLAIDDFDILEAKILHFKEFVTVACYVAESVANNIIVVEVFIEVVFFE